LFKLLNANAILRYEVHHARNVGPRNLAAYQDFGDWPLAG